jgi:hypothetical protein
MMLSFTLYAVSSWMETLKGQMDSLFASALDDKDILVSNGTSNLDAGLAIGKLAKAALSNGCSETLTDRLGEAIVGRAREDSGATHCCCDVLGRKKGRRGFCVDGV